MSVEPDVDITPGVAILGVLSHLNYEPWYALSEYVDNALQSARVEASRIRGVEPDHHLAVSIDIDTSATGSIVIEDNAGGIRRSDFSRAFRAADVPPDRSGLSEFGMGMKSASIWFAKNWKIETTSVGDGSVYEVTFDMDEVLRGRQRGLPIKAEPIDVNTHFTRISLTRLNQIPRGRTLGKIRDHLRDIYRVFLRSGELRLDVSGERLSYKEPRILEAPDTRLVGTEAPTLSRLWRKSVEVTLPSGVSVRGFAALRDEGSTREAGFALFRRGRVIVGSGDTPYRPLAIYGRGNSYRSQRLFGELHIDGLPVSHTKDGFQWGDEEEQLLVALRAQLEEEPLPLLRQAETYRSRQVTRQQSKIITDATSATARSLATALPTLLDDMRLLDDQAETTPENGPEKPSTGTPPYVMTTRNVGFELSGHFWKVVMSVAQESNSGKWMRRSIRRENAAHTDIEIVLNAAHPFVVQFALGDRDSFEAVLRLAISVVVAERLARDAGLEFASQMTRNIDTVLTRALSTRDVK